VPPTTVGTSPDSKPAGTSGVHVFDSSLNEMMAVVKSRETFNPAIGMSPVRKIPEFIEAFIPSLIGSR
jgi:hypothetical protein